MTTKWANQPIWTDRLTHLGQTQSRFQSSAEARIQGRHPTCRSGNNARHWPDSPAQGDFAFALPIWQTAKHIEIVTKNDLVH